MITYQGWAIVREAFDEAGESEDLRRKIQMQLDEKVRNLNQVSVNRFLHVQFFNGELKLIVAGASNHKTSLWFEVLALFEWLAKNAVGSFGLLHMHDDEDTEGLENKFQVYCLKKGCLSHGAEAKLSPVVPELELI